MRFVDNESLLPYYKKFLINKLNLFFRFFKMDNPQDKARRSVFVGNIPYEATEETLYGIFGEVGPVKGLRLVTDKETGKPKGYGFVEYNDPSTAQSAIRNLAGREIHGRNLRVDSASKTQQGSSGGYGQDQGGYNQGGYNQGGYRKYDTVSKLFFVKNFL